jgi:hypothetical protein
MGVTSLRPGRRLVTLKELEAVYHRDAAAFERVASAIVGDRKFGCDAVHDAFVQALRHRDRFRGDAPVEASVWRFVIGEARKRRARVVRGRPPRVRSATSTRDQNIPSDAEPTGWESVIDGAETANRRRWRWFVRAVSAAGLAVAVGAVALVWPFGGGAHGTVLQRAAAALGDGPVLHFVIRGGWGGALVDLKTGSRHYVYATEEFWYERDRGVHEVFRFAGVAQSDATYSAGRFSFIDRTLGNLVTRYRQALGDGSALVLGRDIVEGRPVYWIRVDSETLAGARNTLHHWAHDVAVSQETFAPVAARELRDGKPSRKGESIVLKAESVPEGNGYFRRIPPDSSGREWRIATMGFLTPSEASAVLGRPARWAGHSVRGLALARIWKDARSEGYDRESGRWARTYTGVTFYYGALDDNGDPAGSPTASTAVTPIPFVQVSESRTLDPLFQRVVTNYSPPEGSILVFDSGTAVMQAGGLHIALEASSEDLLLAAARRLERVPSTDGGPATVA